jgi:hypothetical protein
MTSDTIKFFVAGMLSGDAKARRFIITERRTVTVCIGLGAYYEHIPGITPTLQVHTAIETALASPSLAMIPSGWLHPSWK